MLLVPSSGSAPGPLALGAAKSVAGHTEPAAGALGLVQLALELGQLFRAPLHHMACPSAHVVSTLLAGGAGGRAISIARQCVSLQSGAADAARAGGVSSFAFQGTNAHAVARAAGLSAMAAGQQARGLRTQSIWAAEIPHVFLQSAGLVNDIRFEIPLRGPAATLLLDALLLEGRVLAPSVLLEFAGAASALSQDTFRTNHVGLALTAVSIPEPAEILARHTLSTVVDASVGLVTVKTVTDVLLVANVRATTLAPEPSLQTAPPVTSGSPGSLGLAAPGLAGRFFLADPGHLQQSIDLHSSTYLPGCLASVEAVSSIQVGGGASSAWVSQAGVLPVGLGNGVNLCGVTLRVLYDLYDVGEEEIVEGFDDSVE